MVTVGIFVSGICDFDENATSAYFSKFGSKVKQIQIRKHELKPPCCYAVMTFVSPYTAPAILRLRPHKIGSTPLFVKQIIIDNRIPFTRRIFPVTSLIVRYHNDPSLTETKIEQIVLTCGQPISVVNNSMEKLIEVTFADYNAIDLFEIKLLGISSKVVTERNIPTAMNTRPIFLGHCPITETTQLDNSSKKIDGMPILSSTILSTPTASVKVPSTMQQQPTVAKSFTANKKPIKTSDSNSNFVPMPTQNSKPVPTSTPTSTIVNSATAKLTNVVEPVAAKPVPDRIVTRNRKGKVAEYQQMLENALQEIQKQNEMLEKQETELRILRTESRLYKEKNDELQRRLDERQKLKDACQSCELHQITITSLKMSLYKMQKNLDSLKLANEKSSNSNLLENQKTASENQEHLTPRRFLSTRINRNKTQQAISDKPAESSRPTSVQSQLTSPLSCFDRNITQQNEFDSDDD